jgi:FkbM family methyltransferase
MPVRSHLITFIRRIPGTRHLAARFHAQQASASFPLQDWWQRSYWEPTVALAIRDHCRPGNVVFDVGANAGALSLMMSRLVGPRGIVCAFEASPRIIDKTHYNLVKAGCHNVTLFHNAVWHSSGALVNIAPGSHLNDRIEEGPTGMSVRTVALDDVANASDLRPSFIKMDIEGAEYDALRGMPQLLRDVRPVLVLEQSPQDMRCHALLSAEGYDAVDLASYVRVVSNADFQPGVEIANVLFVPHEAVDANPYFDQAAPIIAADLPSEMFQTARNGDITLVQPVHLSPGRYIVRTDFVADGTDNQIYAGVEADGEVVFRYHTFTKFMAQSYTDWVIHLERNARISPYLRFIKGRDPSLRWKGAKIIRLPAFDAWKPPIIE